MRGKYLLAQPRHRPWTIFMTRMRSVCGPATCRPTYMRILFCECTHGTFRLWFKDMSGTNDW